MTLTSTNADDLRDLEGRVFDGRFRLTKLIDFGGFGAVYEATDDKIPNRRVAVKLGMAVSSERAFTREAMLVGQVNHDNIVKVYDYGVESGLPFIVMDMLQGERLDTLAKAHAGRLPRDLLIKFVTEVGAALSHAHRKNLVHRDLKPKNVILVDTGTVDDQGEPLKRFVLLDFGIAGKVDASDSMANHTMAGAGTPEYMSPEQIAGADSTSATDIYTFGVLLYQLLTGRVPFPMSGNTPAAIAMVVTSIVNESPPPFAIAAPTMSFPSGVEEVVLQCLEKEPKRRPASIREVRKRFLDAYAPSLERDTDFGGSTMTPQQLADASGSITGTFHTWKDSTTRIGPASTMVPLIAVLSLILLATGAVFAYWYFRPEPTPVVLQLKGPPLVDVVAGKTKPFNLTLARPSGVETVELRFEERLYGVTVDIPKEVNDGFVECSIKADLNAEPTEDELLIFATAGDQTAELAQPIKLIAPDVWSPTTIPAAFEVEPDGELVEINGRVFRSVLELRVEKEVVRFRLIDTRSSTERADPFYIMENKVWNGLYKVFEDEAPNIGNREDVLGDNRYSGPSFPAFGMTANDAHAFTQWLGGQEASLPAVQQWWIAAGSFEKSPKPDFDVGPFRQMGDDTSQLDEPPDKPRPVGESSIDVSVHGIKDMAVNGSEWTSTLFLTSRTAEFPTFEDLDSLFLVGCPLDYERLTFEDANLYFGTEGLADSAQPTRGIDDCGFRVVINPRR